MASLKDFGQDLKALRESKSITIAEISAQTRINPKFLEKMEEGNFVFQPDTYMRAFIRGYARAINENEEHLLSDYNRAKSGNYVKKSARKDEIPINIKPVTESDKLFEEKKSIAGIEKVNEPFAEKKKSYEYEKEENDEEYSSKSVTQKILLVLLIIAILAGAYYLYTYLNSSDKSSNTVKPKSFSEIAGDYENKMTGKNDSAGIKDSLANVNAVNDSLKLTVKASKDVRIKVYIDEKRIIEEEISAKDSLSIFAKDQFRFSASGNSMVDLYLNGKFLKKPAHLTTGSIKNLIINKNGIVSE
jgi:cytoskeletal protein RodZ